MLESFPMNIAALSYGSAALGFALLTIMMAIGFRQRALGVWLFLATAVTGLWAAVAALVAAGITSTMVGLQLLELGRGIVWLIFLAHLLRLTLGETTKQSSWLRYWHLGISAAGLSIGGFYGVLQGFVSAGMAGQFMIGGLLIIAIAGLLLIEQIFCNSSENARWGVKYLLIALAGLFGYDFFLYAEGLLFQRLDSVLWAARGFTECLLIPLLALGSARNNAWAPEVHISRQVVFHTATLTATGLYLLAMAAAGYYLRTFGGSWGGLFQVVFLFAAFLMLAVIIFSGQLRGRLRVFLAKHFYSRRFDYREEWLKLSRTLGSQTHADDIYRRAILALTEGVDSVGGYLLLGNRAGYYELVDTLGLADPQLPPVTIENDLRRLLEQEHWIIDLSEQRSPEADVKRQVALPNWLCGLERAWLVVPLMQNESLLGIAILAEARAPRRLNWEEFDLLKTLSWQVASHIALYRATKQLMESQQFASFHRLSAFVVHDLKNVAGQLALITDNADQHKDNPEFIADTFATVEHATARLNRMLAQLRQGQGGGNKSIIDIVQSVTAAIDLCQNRRPRPYLDPALPSQTLQVLADREQFIQILTHLLANAQEATAAEGQVKVAIDLDLQHELILLDICDTGCGMSPEFVRQQLFRPFVTTKGNSGMGIGAYEAREFAEAHGGKIAVASTPGRGTCLRLQLPRYHDAPVNKRETQVA